MKDALFCVMEQDDIPPEDSDEVEVDLEDGSLSEFGEECDMESAESRPTTPNSLEVNYDENDEDSELIRCPAGTAASMLCPADTYYRGFNEMMEHLYVLHQCPKCLFVRS